MGHVTRYTANEITAKGSAGIIEIAEGMQVDHVSMTPIRVYLSSNAAEEQRVSVDLPDYLTGQITLTLRIWFRGEAGELARVSSDQGDAISFAASGGWQLADVNLEIDADAVTKLYFGFSAATYSNIDWSEATITSGTFAYPIRFGEDEVHRLYREKKLIRRPWPRRNELVAGDICDAPGVYTDNGSHLWVFPIDQDALDAGATVTVEMTGRKLEFNDDDIVPFDEMAINAAGIYARYKLLKYVDRVNEGWKVQQDYEMERALIIADKNSE